MLHIAHPRGRNRALAPAAFLLLALCLLAVGVQAVPDPAATAALVVSGPGLYELDHDLAPSDPIGVRINSSDVVFDAMGHSITGTEANGSIGVLVTGRFTAAEGEMIANVTVRNVTISGWGTGIQMAEVSGTVVEHIVAEQNGDGLSISPSTGIAGDHRVRDSVFRENTGNGLLLFYPAEGIAVERCAITGNGIGISAYEISHGAPNTLADSEISGNAGDGLNSHGGSFAVVRNCTVSGNGGDGMEFEHGGAEIVGCHIEENAAAGLHVSDRGGSDIHGNWIEGNGVGIAAGGDWPSHVRNNYLNNTDNGYFGIPYDRNYLNYEKTAGRNIVGGPYLGGNFWANPNGTGFSQTHADADHDGICDEPYQITEDATDYLPLAPSPGTPVIAPTPYKPHAVPGKIEAEDYDVGGENVSYHDTTPGNAGGAYRHDDVDIETENGITDVGWIRDGEYLIYTVNVTQAGFYTMTARAATPNDERTATISVNSNPQYFIRFANTGSFSRYTTVVGDDVYLPAGTDILRLTFSGDGENLDWIAFEPEAPTRTPFEIPCVIQAEDYEPGGYVDTTPGNQGGAYRQDDVDIEAGASGYDVGWIRTGESLTYEIYVPEDGTFEMTARIASPNSGRSIAVSYPEQLATIAVPNTGSFSTYRNVSVPVTLKSGYHALQLTFAGDGQNIDWISFTPASGPAPGPNGMPFKPLAIPGTIQAEDYNIGGEGVAYHDTTPGNEGGADRHDDVDIETGSGITNVGWIRNGEYLTYTANITTAGAYTMSAHVASPDSGRSIAVSVDGTATGAISVPNTGSFEAFRTVETPIVLAAGTHTLNLAFIGDGQNLDWIAFAPAGAGTPTPTPTPSVETPTPTPTPVAGGASFTAAPLSAPKGSAVKFTLTPASGRTVASAWWSFDAPAHLNSWNSRATNPTFFYPAAGSFSPLVKITYTDGSTETVQRTAYVRAT